MDSTQAPATDAPIEGWVAAELDRIGALPLSERPEALGALERRLLAALEQPSTA